MMLQPWILSALSENPHAASSCRGEVKAVPQTVQGDQHPSCRQPCPGIHLTNLTRITF